ncbi:hypothetical protein [Streptomyces sp. NPDC021096]|uniref:hypothetical protein n=1 Tax=Streptomyces sp. NPDC021096 TaxID=3154792 RepID=UPI00340CDE7F
MTTPARDDLVNDVRTLSESEALRALTVLVEESGLATLTMDTPAMETGLDGATDAVEYIPPVGHSAITEGGLARLALEYAATQGDRDGLLVEILEYARSPVDRFDPTAVPVGVLIVTLLQTEVLAKRHPSGKWSLTVHKRALRDSTLGRLLTALLSHLTNGK